MKCELGLICDYGIEGYFTWVDFLHTQVKTKGRKFLVDNENVLRIDSSRGVLILEDCIFIDRYLANIKFKLSLMKDKKVIYKYDRYVVRRSGIVSLVEWGYS